MSAPASASATPSLPTAPKPAVPPSPPLTPGEQHDAGTVRRESVEVERWVVHGLVKVTGDARLGDGTLDGTVSIGGQLSANAVRYKGSLDVGGPVGVRDRFEGHGSLRVGATFHAGEADVRGSVRIGGAPSVDRTMTVHGSLVAPSLTAGGLDLEGAAELPGDVVAGSVSARLSSDSTFGTVRAKTVVLRARTPSLVEKVLSRLVTVTVERVEADSAEFEAVDVQFVRAGHITLGRHAHVTAYEGTIVKRHPSSRVGFESKSRPPHGLSR